MSRADYVLAERPAPFTIGYQDSVKWQEMLAQAGGDVDNIPDLDACYETQDAITKSGAISKARALAKQHSVTVTIYALTGLAFDEECGWRWEDQVTIATVDTDGSVDRYPEFSCQY